MAAAAEADTMTVTTKMAAGSRREAGVAEVGAGEEEEEEAGEEVEGGEGEGVQIIAKEDSLNSSSNRAASSSPKLALAKADSTAVENTVGHHSRVHNHKINYFSADTESKMPFHAVTSILSKVKHWLKV